MSEHSQLDSRRAAAASADDSIATRASLLIYLVKHRVAALVKREIRDLESKSV